MPFDLAILRRRRSVATFPTASFDFLSGLLDSRITFSRGTNATLVDSTGRVTYAPANLFTFSQEFDNAAWVKGNVGVGLVPTVTANAGTAPDGTNTADRAQFSLGGGTTSGDQSILRQTIATDTSGSTLYAFSLWVRSTDGTSTYNMRMFGAPAASQAVTVTGTWTRIFVVGGGANTNYSLVLRGGQTPTNSNTADILVWGGQLEPVTYQTTPGTYNATTASAYYGPRFDYDPVTLAPRGLLIEEARTNLVTYSDDWSNAAWVKSLGTVTANATASPDGTTNADAFIESASAGQHFVSQASGSSATGSFTFSVFVKANGRSGANLWIRDGAAGVVAEGFFNLATGTATVSAMLLQTGWSASSATIQPFANGWYRCTLTATADATLTQAKNGFIRLNDGTGSNPNYTGNGTSGAYLWGAQLEAGAFATSYIPTVASTVSRSADVATMTGTNFSSWYNQSEGTFVADFDKASTAARGLVFCAGNDAAIAPAVTNIGADGQNNGKVRAFIENAGVLEMGNLTLADYSTNTPIKVALAYATNNAVGAAAGALGTVDTSVTVPTINIFQIGALKNSTSSTSAFLNGHIRAIAYYNTRLPNTQLQTLTAPSLASPLALDFISPTYTVGY